MKFIEINKLFNYRSINYKIKLKNKIILLIKKIYELFKN